MKRNRIVVLMIVALLVVSIMATFVACADDFSDKSVEQIESEKNDENKDNSNLKKITFVLDWAPNTNHTGLYVAKKLGYFEEAGLDVNFIQPSNAGASGDVAVGNGQFGIDFQEQMIFNEMNNVGVTAVAAVIQHNTSGILSKKSSSVLTPKDMEGMEYATWGLPGEQAIIKAMVKNDGGDPNKVTMIPNTIENIVAEFSRPDGVDCVWSFAAWDKIFAEKQGLEGNFIKMRDLPRLDYYTPVIIANNDLIKNDPDTVRGFITAAAKGYTYAIENPKAAADILMELNPALKESAEVIYESQNFLANEYKSDADYWGQIKADRWDGFFDLMCEIGGENFPTQITDGYGFTNEFLPKPTANK